MPTGSCATCQTVYNRPTVNAVADAVWNCDTQHRTGNLLHLQLPTVTWHEQALLAVKALAATGKPFVISQVIDYGVPDAPNPRTDWSNIQKEAEAFGWITPTGRLGHSVRPTTKRSPCTEWVGTFAAHRTAQSSRGAA